MTKIKKSTLRNVILVTLLSFAIVQNVDAQKRNKKVPKNPQKEAMKKEAQREKATAAAEEKGRKRHVKLQDKDVRKRMKRSRKQGRRNDLGKRDPFVKRIFSRKKRRK